MNRSLLTLGLFLLSAAMAQASPRYSVTDLGTLGGKSSAANAINLKGDVAGQAETRDGNPHGFLWRHGRMHNLGTLPGYISSTGIALNNRGQVVGNSTGLKQGVSRIHAFLWQNGKMLRLAKPDGSDSLAYAISDKGCVVGETDLIADAGKSIYDRAFFWKNGRMHQLGTLGGWDSWARAINDTGQILGMAETRRGDQHHVTWENGQVHDLGKSFLGGTWDEPYPFSRWAQAASFAQVARLPLPRKAISRHIASLNDHRVAVGYYITEIGSPASRGEIRHACLWQSGRIYNLNKLIRKCSGWNLQDARAINNKGRIVGTGTHHGWTRAFLLTPIMQ